jgi:hypothetical protein
MYKHTNEVARGSYRFPTVKHSVLSRCLVHTQHLLSDVALTGHPDAIEHIVLGENGIFVLESRDWAGRISCIGDSWVNNGTMMPSPSLQVKDAARAIRTILLASGVIQYPNLWVEGIVVLLNENIDLRTNVAHVPILKLTELYDYLTTTHTGFQFSQQELEDIRNILIS